MNLLAQDVSHPRVGPRTKGGVGVTRHFLCMGENMAEISISTPHHQLKSYLATPKSNGPWPGVIVLHDIFGLTDVTRGHADWLASQG